MLLLDLRCAIGCDEPKSTQRTLVEVWWFSLNHLNGHDAQRPNIDLATVLFAGDNLWCHPVWRSYHGRTLVVVLVDLSAEPKIGYKLLVL